MFTAAAETAPDDPGREFRLLFAACDDGFFCHVIYFVRPPFLAEPFAPAAASFFNGTPSLRNSPIENVTGDCSGEISGKTICSRTPKFRVPPWSTFESSRPLKSRTRGNTIV